MMEIVRITDDAERRINSAKAILEEAHGKDFESVIVFGFKEGKIGIYSSKAKDYLTIIGALEEAKQILINNSAR